MLVDILILVLIYGQIVKKMQFSVPSFGVSVPSGWSLIHPGNADFLGFVIITVTFLYLFPDDV